MQETGAELHSELESIDRLLHIRGTPSLDRRVRSGIAALKRPHLLRYTGLIAACLVVALTATFFLRYNDRGATDDPGSISSSAPSSSSSLAAQPSASAPDLPSASPSAQPSKPASGTYEVIPLSFELPEQFTIASTDQDMGKTIYRLSDSMLDDVVLTMERSGDITRYDALAEFTIGGQSVFGSSGAGYCLLAFMDAQTDILYTLTCKYDVNTLVALSGSILL